MQSSAIIELKNICAGYDNQTVLTDINLSVKSLDFIGIIGPNGGGKSTLLKVILGLLKPTQGQISIFNSPVHKGRKYIGYVPQSVNCDHDFPINVWDVVQMGRLSRKKLFQKYNSQDQEITAYALRSVDLLHLKNRSIKELSGGQRQRVYIARALATQPQILLLDEPTASVDPQMRNSIYDLLQQLNETLTILMISHDMSAVSTYVKTIGCLNHKLHYHGEKLITSAMLEETYQCPIDLIAHGLPHRVLNSHCCDDHHDS